MIKFLHTADIHLDSPLRGLSKHESAPIQKIREAPRVALANLVSLAIEQAVDFFIIAGDIYDGDWDDYNTGQFFNAEMRKLNEQGIPVYLLYGNHDAQSIITSELSFPSNVHIFDTAKANTFKVKGQPVALHGQGFKERHVYDRLANNYPEAEPGKFNIGVLHTQVEGYEGHAPYAPCTLQELSNKGYDYWALGHIHKQNVLQDQPKVVYPGIPQGRHIKETGEKGCYIGIIGDNLKLQDLRFHAMETLRWENLDIDISPHSSWEEVEDSIITSIRNFDRPSRVELAVFRISLQGESDAHETLQQLGPELDIKLKERLLNDGLNTNTWIESIKINTSPVVDIEDLRQQDSLTDFILTSLESHEFDFDSLSESLAVKLKGLVSFDPESSADQAESVLPTPEEVKDVVLSTLKSGAQN